MSTSKMTLSCSPWGEPCAQIGTTGYAFRAIAECSAYKAQLVRHYKEAHESGIPEGATLDVASRPHDFGTYWEVEVRFDDDSKEAVEAAYWLEANAPEAWDDEARSALALASWDEIKRFVKAGPEHFLFCSLGWTETDEFGDDWVRTFHKQATEHGLEAYAKDGHLYVKAGA